eukprot:COSAG02_NODE_14941_length_1219_cov_8.642602_1_plen_177_part_10
MWYAYYGETLTSASAFESRMDGLCRELGCRGRADACVEGDGCGLEKQIDPQLRVGVSLGLPNASSTMTRGEVAQLKIGALVRYAVQQGVDATALDSVEDSNDPHGAIVALLFPQASADAALTLLRAELAGLPYISLVRKAVECGVDDESMNNADNADDASTALVELIMQAQGTAAV